MKVKVIVFKEFGGSEYGYDNNTFQPGETMIEEELAQVAEKEGWLEILGEKRKAVNAAPAEEKKFDGAPENKSLGKAPENKTAAKPVVKKAKK